VQQSIVRSWAVHAVCQILHGRSGTRARARSQSYDLFDFTTTTPAL
jgi:hypothetical protein